MTEQLFTGRVEEIIDGRAYIVAVTFVDDHGLPAVESLTITGQPLNGTVLRAIRLRDLTDRILDEYTHKEALPPPTLATVVQTIRDQEKGRVRVGDLWHYPDVRVQVHDAGHGVDVSQCGEKKRLPTYQPEHWRKVADLYRSAPKPSQATKHVRESLAMLPSERGTVTRWISRMRYELIDPQTGEHYLPPARQGRATKHSTRDITEAQ